MAYTPDESSTGMSPTTAAGLAVVLTFFGALYFLIAERRSRFVKLYAHQSLRVTYVAVLGGLCNLTRFALPLFTTDSPLVMVFQGAAAVLFFLWAVSYIALAVSAFSGKVLALPLIGAGLRKKLGLG
jgi:uncharacterized membrane protein